MTKKKSPIAAMTAGDPVRVIDAASGETISHVLSADAEAGKLSRFAVEDGNLVRDGDALKVIDEDRAIRIEPIEPVVVDPVDLSSVDGEAQG